MLKELIEKIEKISFKFIPKQSFRFLQSPTTQYKTCDNLERTDLQST